jgi:predicted amino acid racemase
VLLDRVLDRNPSLIEAAIELHQEGAVPAGTFIVDLDAISANAAALAREARVSNVRTYVMTKSYGRNPFVTHVALAQGIDSTVAVEPREADIFARFGVPIGHVGHIANVPRHAAHHVVGLGPELVTVYTEEAAADISRAAVDQGVAQDLLVRINNPADKHFSGLVGGLTEDEAVRAVERMAELANVRIAGLTTYPCLSYATKDAYKAQPTDAFFTMLRAKETLERELGLTDLRVNAPALNNCATFPILARLGATDMEPGHALLGSSLVHGEQHLPEIPAQVFVSEVMHRWDGELYTVGGGMMYLEKFGGAADDPVSCIVGRSVDQARGTRCTLLDIGVVNYYSVCTDHPAAAIGDSAIFALYPQYFVNRAYVAAVSGISRRSPRVEGLFDAMCHALDDSLVPLPAAAVGERAAALGRSYAQAT